MIRSLLRVFTGGLLRVQVGKLMIIYRKLTLLSLEISVGACLFSAFLSNCLIVLGDELNSLAYTFSNLRFLGCCYNVRWQEDDTRTFCSNQTSWATPVLQSVPAAIRFSQCLRRYYDSEYTMKIHLVNAGKYVSVIAQNFAFYGWRDRGGGHYEHYTFAIWIVFALIASSYTASWDLLMDWSLLQRKSKRKFLRDTLAFENAYVSTYKLIAYFVN